MNAPSSSGGSGTGGSGTTGAVTLSPATYNFPMQNAGTASKPTNFTLTNGQNASLSITSIQIAAPFTQTNNCGSAVAAGQSCNIAVVYSPTAAGSSKSTLTVTDSGAGSPQTAAITGTASTGGSVTLTPGQYAFPNQVVGSASSAANFTLTNGQTVALAITGIQIAAPFSETNDCGASLAPGKTCTIGVTFTPTAAGGAKGTLIINDDGPGAPQSAAITGTGVLAPATATLAPGQFAFPNQTVGGASQPANFTLSNTSTVPLAISGIQIAAPFAETNNCGNSLAAGQSCTIAVVYTPTTAGPAAASLTVNDSATGSPQVAAITGTGVAGTVTLTPAQFTFPNQGIGSASQPANFTLTNQQATALAISGIQIAAPFTETNTCGNSVAAGQSCTISVVFTPTAAAASTAALTVADNATGSPQTASISGTGVSGGITVTPAAGGLGFYQQLVNTSSTPLPVTITNNQTGTLTINSITTSPDFPFTSTCGGSGGPGTIGPGQTCTIDVSFLPQAIGQRSATLNVSYSAAGSPLVMTLTGIGFTNSTETVTVAPYEACVLPGGTQQFTGTVNNVANPVGVTWYVDGIQGGNSGSGLITTSGVYSAPATAALHAVSALAQDGSGVSGKTTINVTPTLSFGVYPNTTSLPPSGQQSFQAQVCYQPDGNALNWDVDGIPGGNAAVGTVDSNGNYTAPATAGVHYVHASDPILKTTSGGKVTIFSGVTVDFGSRTNTAHPIPPNLFGYARAESIQSTADRNLLTQGALTYARLYAQIPAVYATPTPDWTQIDPMVSSIQAAGQKPLIQMAYTPPYLQPSPNGCSVPYYATPTNITAWAQIAASYVQHFDQKFPGLVQDYEIWNEPNASGLCPSAGSTALQDYQSIYAAAAPLMKQQAAADGATIRVGGPVLSGYNGVWLQAFLSNPAITPYVDFVSYHNYMFGAAETNAQWDSYNGITSVYEKTQDPGNGAAATYQEAAAKVAAGGQPSPTTTPIYVTEYNTNFGFVPDCCKNNPTYSPVWNALYVSDLLDLVYTQPYAPPARLVYFAGSAYPYFCLIGVVDQNYDCLYSEGAQPVGYPQYYAYQLLGSPNYLNMIAGGNMAASVSPGPTEGGPVVLAFYEPDQDAVVITNPTAATYSNIQVTANNTGYSTAQGTLYQIVNGASISANPLTLTSSGQNYTATISIPPYSVQAISLKGQ